MGKDSTLTKKRGGAPFIPKLEYAPALFNFADLGMLCEIIQKLKKNIFRTDNLFYCKTIFPAFIIFCRMSFCSQH